jgi:hypothetical protein
MSSGGRGKFPDKKNFLTIGLSQGTIDRISIQAQGFFSDLFTAARRIALQIVP